MKYLVLSKNKLALGKPSIKKKHFLIDIRQLGGGSGVSFVNKKNIAKIA